MLFWIEHKVTSKLVVELSCVQSFCDRCKNCQHISALRANMTNATTNIRRNFFSRNQEETKAFQLWTAGMIYEYMQRNLEYNMEKVFSKLKMNSVMISCTISTLYTFLFAFILVPQVQHTLNYVVIAILLLYPQINKCCPQIYL